MKKRLTLIKVTFRIPAFLIAPLVWSLLLYRRIRYGYPFRRIPLTRGKYAIVDPEDYCSLIEYKWYPCRSGGTFYARRGRRRDDDSSDFSTQMHRNIIKAPPGMVIDHINHNGLENRKANLRIATQRQNPATAESLRRLHRSTRASLGTSNSKNGTPESWSTAGQFPSAVSTTKSTPQKPTIKPQKSTTASLPA